RAIHRGTEVAVEHAAQPIPWSVYGTRTTRGRPTAVRYTDGETRPAPGRTRRHRETRPVPGSPPGTAEQAAQPDPRPVAGTRTAPRRPSDATYTDGENTARSRADAQAPGSAPRAAGPRVPGVEPRGTAPQHSREGLRGPTAVARAGATRRRVGGRSPPAGSPDGGWRPARPRRTCRGPARGPRPWPGSDGRGRRRGGPAR